MIRDLLMRRKIFEAEAEVDSFIEENEIDLESNTVIQSLIFDKEAFQDEAEAREWAADHGFHSGKVDETEESFRIRQLDSSQFDKTTLRTIEIRRGIQAVIGQLAEQIYSEIMFSEKGEMGLGLKLETINFHEGLPHIIQIARVAEGEHPSYGKLKITQQDLEAMERNFKSNVTGVDLAINEDHKKNEAFGWFKDVFLSFDKQTLYAQIQWNNKGMTALSEKEYRYFSPEFRFNYVHPHSGKEHGPTLLGGALTNYPFLKMDAITALNNKTKNKGETTVEKTIELSIHNQTVVELSNKVTAAEAKAKKAEDQVMELNAKVEELTNQIENSKKQAIHEKLFNEGKISKAQLVALNEGKGMLEVLALAETMHTEPKGSDVAPKVTVELSAKEKEFAAALGLTDEEFAIYNK
jgi:phage I-like protein